MSSVLNPICRGLVGYVSYLASCDAATVYSEYLLYEPLLRIAKSQGYTARCEVPVPRINGGVGDHPRIDFYLQRSHDRLGLEVKWIKSKSSDISKDVNKLRSFNIQTGAKGYVLLFGRSSFFGSLKPKYTGTEMSWGTPVRWNAKRTDYSARWLRII
jgi:hypothetical protein